MRRLRDKIRDKLLPMLLVHRASPEKLAGSFAFGLGSIFIPAPGVQTPFLIPICWAFGLQLPLVYAINWLNNPATWIPICIAGYSVGRLLLTGQWALSWPDSVPVPESLRDLDQCELYRALLGPWLLGSIVLVVAVTALTYFPALILIRRVRAHHPDRKDVSGYADHK